MWKWLFPLIICCLFRHFQDEEDIKAIARLFADMGDAYVELIATGSYPFFLSPFHM